MEPEICQGIGVLWRALERSQGPTASRNLSRKQEQNAKTVTSLFTLLSVLGVGVFKIIT
jgi:hypothetical protein